MYQVSCLDSLRRNRRADNVQSSTYNQTVFTNGTDCAWMMCFIQPKSLTQCVRTNRSAPLHHHGDGDSERYLTQCVRTNRRAPLHHHGDGDSVRYLTQCLQLAFTPPHPYPLTQTHTRDTHTHTNTH